ncbi:hypothetical protein BHM03_00010138 [Ensete ventricosum]|uniref:Secreted protein n=1 Tax=Ensete ventricosum TaxID=4639 RepID=A0A445MCX2_ENSVE|nr:hypothetical protein BHM03_00010138 [Ensete ventricosum]
MSDRGAAPSGSRPLWPGRRRLPLAAWLQVLPTPVNAAPAGASHARGRPRMLAVAPTRGFGRGRTAPCRGPWQQPAAPYSRPGHGWPTLHGGWPWLATPPPTRCLRCENTARTRRTILRDSISSHIV